MAEDHCVLEFERQGAETKLPPEAWARGVAYSLRHGYKFHRWEIANEPYSSMWGNGQAFPTPETFIAHFKAVSRAIRAVDPHAQIGVDIHRDDVKWGNYLLKQLAGDYDFVAPHYYCGANVRELPFEEIALTENYRMLDRALRTQALIRAYNHGRDVYQYDTEWGMICNAPGGKEADYEGRNANIIGTLHRAVRLIYYAREDILRGASGWQMLNRLNAARLRHPLAGGARTSASCSTGFTITSTATWANGRWQPMVSRPITSRGRRLTAPGSAAR